MAKSSAAEIRDSEIHVWWQRRISHGARAIAPRSDAFLCFVLARYSGASEGTIEVGLVRDSLGKLRIEPRLAPALAFNLSHSGIWMAVAVTHGAGMGIEVGIDIERLRTLSSVEPFITRCCTTAEAELVRQLPPRCRADAMLRLWTLKEAYLKAMGTGILGPLREVETCAAPKGVGSLVSCAWAARGMPAWHAQPISAPRGYVASVCCSHPGRVVRHFVVRPPLKEQPSPDERSHRPPADRSRPG